ncbi:Nucleotide-binding universal stress protein, UspA family [Pseudonocardia thermophila]|jgi:Universal stress protein UspA and related nucleotide-binding proteins|uniref:Nucleotide-binding universal stress protein, UspA family n=1 Tax=Pseudonocardia thermophila TaxID=1848 RepID=A0A1M6V1E2_PSETH|nr:universal stress protein [Pseudonocardia thermophila]SHK75185.1 Nucleotide-binding universal stress protein, UspA family [Pseudonocardia thermophila]
MDHQHVPPSARPGVIVGTDGSTTALRAVAWAAAEAKLRGAGLLIVHAAPYADTESGRRHANAILTRARTVARHERGLPITTRVLLPEPRTALREVAQDADLLVVGMIAETAADALIGSVATAITAHAPCPVAVVRGHHQGHDGSRPVLLALGDAAEDRPVIDAAFADAELHGSSLVVVHASGDPTAAERLEANLQPWRARYPGVAVDVQVARGGTLKVLLTAAHTARLVVAGSPSRGAVARTILGSTAHDLVRCAPCPVLVVPRPPAASAATAPAAETGGEALL